VCPLAGSSFGRNNVQCTGFEWQVLSTDHFDISCYPERKAVAEQGADRAADRYMVTRDLSLLQERDRMGKGAALAVVGMEVSFGIFTYFLLSP